MSEPSETARSACADRAETVEETHARWAGLKRAEELERLVLEAEDDIKALGTEAHPAVLMRLDRLVRALRSTPAQHEEIARVDVPPHPHATNCRCYSCAPHAAPPDLPLGHVFVPNLAGTDECAYSITCGQPRSAHEPKEKP